MEKALLLERLKDAEGVEAARRAYVDFWAEDDAVEVALETLAGFSGHPEGLSEEGCRRQLRLVLLGLAIRKEKSAYPDYRRMICRSGFLENLGKEDWLVVEIPRILGLLGGPDCLRDLESMVLDPDNPMEIREQVMMAMIFRWLGRQESDGDVYDTVKDMLGKGLEGLEKDSQLGMALVVNAIAVGGSRLKTPIMDFVGAGDECLRRSVSEKNIRSFLSLGSQRVKDMLRQNYEGDFKDPDHEIAMMIDPPGEQEPVSPRTGRPIVREEPRIRRNDPCPCGSGRKYKKCCGR